MKLTKSSNYNPNYLAKVVQLTDIKNHPKADRLNITIIDYQTVVIDKSYKVGDYVVYFPVGSSINKELISNLNSFSNSSLNKDTSKKGYFDNNARLKTIKLKDQESLGWILKVETLLKSLDIEEKVDWDKYKDVEFDTINNILLLTKYVPKVKQESKRDSTSKKSNKNFKKSEKLEVLDFNEHVSTNQLFRNIQNLELEDIISISYKTHGTSFRVGNLLVKRNLKWYEKIAKKIGVNVSEYEYRYVFGSRKKVLKPKNSYNLYHEICKKLEGKIPEGFTLYGECIGYTGSGAYIQKDYDYGCNPNEFKLQIYRITFTNSKGFITELTKEGIEEFCEKYDLDTVHYFFEGPIFEYFDFYDVESIEEDHENAWKNVFIHSLKENFTEKDCYICNNKVPEEGIVLRKESIFKFEAYKLKSFKFLGKEEKDLEDNTILN